MSAEIAPGASRKDDNYGTKNMPNKSKPLYYRIVDSIREDIANKVYNTGDLLPTEEELQERYGASRTSIRNAMGILERERLISRKQGRGTIVIADRTVQRLNSISSMTETFLQKGITLSVSGLSIEKIKSPPEVMKALGLVEAVDVYLVRRTRVIGDEPIALVNNYLVAKRVPRLEDRQQKLHTTGLYALLEGEYNIKLDHALENISVYICGPLEAELLHVPQKTPLFHNLRTTYLEDGSAFEYVSAFIKCDRFEYTVYLEGRVKGG